MSVSIETPLSDAKTLLEAYLAQQNFIASLQSQHLAETQEHEEELRLRDREIDRLKEMVLLLRRARFGIQSEKLKKDVHQLGMFNEAEVLAREPEKEAAGQEVKSYRRGRPTRKPLPDYIEREEEIIELAEADRVCPHGHVLEKIGEEVSERLEVIPMQLKVKKMIRIKYACRSCAGEMRIAPLPVRILPKTNAGEGLLAHIATSKYADGLPLYRQEAMWKRLEIDLDRTTMARWMVGLGEAVEPLLNLMREDLQSSIYVQCDESRLQVLKEPGRKATTSSFMWVLARAAPEEKPIVVFEYDPTRGGSVPLRLLDGFVGYLQADGYEGYNAICATKGVIRLGCMAHARRKFFEAGQASSEKGVAKMFLDEIAKLYEIERRMDKRPSAEVFTVRQREAKPILETIQTWLEDHRHRVPPQSTLGKAIGYAFNEWPYLIRYLDAGHLRIDNNFVENKIRPFALGRKNWLFSSTPEGARASASLYSLIETAKANGLNPFRYLRHVFEKLPRATTLEQTEVLLPYNVKL
jgi:transposase